MQGVWAKLATAVVFALPIACGSTESNQPQAPASAGGGAGGMASGGASGSGGGSSNVHVCQSGVGCGSFNPPDERRQVQGTNGTFEDHCDETGRLVQYGCATRVPCSGPDCVPDATVPYNTGEVSSSTHDCPCVDGVCPPL